MRVSPLLAMLVLSVSIAGAQGGTAPLPQVHAPAAGSTSALDNVPGEVQPLAPGARPAETLPRLTLSPAIAELERLEYRGNGFIEVAHAVALLPASDQTLARRRALALEVASRALAARPELSEVDVSVYDRATYGGFGGPLPLFTASVPRARLADFRAYAQDQGSYDRVYEGGTPATIPPTVVARVREDALTFFGSASERLRQSLTQSVSQSRGGERDGLLFRGPTNRRVAALTFDDAPHPLYEPLLLDLLRRAGVRATLFVIGRNAVAYPYFVRDMVAQGHEVGNHTYHHVRLPGLSPAQVQAELAQANTAISAVTGQPVRYFRPPGGDYSPLTLQVARQEGLITTFWTDDPGDFDNPGDAVVESRLVSHLRPGGIVLQHDNAPEAIDVLRGFLRVARERGVALTTVGEMVVPR
ncbi:polysaccharide deacetylase family protein [Deinococcus sp. Leaf326]|uniref:polysaccharide deacetylase family protein n=1 Tax=Deinococcus sp. Leaf326 TaxID=1736338 RepID=UPI0006FA4B4A|nr:polysaccharide deacetylase family protein [Deinococcus sp. Leaf326]KQR01079.1 oligosaccharide deacetylase [Deinococcus sp. Leaf326]